MTLLSVPDMNCGHCRAGVEAALKPLATLVEVDLAARQVRAEGAEPEALIRALAEAGFPASKIG